MNQHLCYYGRSAAYYMYIYRLHYISHGSCLHWGPFPTWGYSVTWIFWVWASQMVGIPQWCWISHGDVQFPEGHPCSDRTYIDNSQDAGKPSPISIAHRVTKSRNFSGYQRGGDIRRAIFYFWVHFPKLDRWAPQWLSHRSGSRFLMTDSIIRFLPCDNFSQFAVGHPCILRVNHHKLAMNGSFFAM